MKIWVVTNGIYDDETVVGVALSASEAEEMIRRMLCYGSEDVARYDPEFLVLGPFDAGLAYTRAGGKI